MMRTGIGATITLLDRMRPGALTTATQVIAALLEVVARYAVDVNALKSSRRPFESRSIRNRWNITAADSQSTRPDAGAADRSVVRPSPECLHGGGRFGRTAVDSCGVKIGCK